jgi:hypothetical protein
MFVLAWLAIATTNSFLLYLPSRYTRVGLFLFLSAFVLLNLRDAVEEAIVAVRRDRRVLYGLVGVGEASVLGLVFFLPSDRATFNGLNLRWALVLAGLALGVLGAVRIRRSSPPAARTSRWGRTIAGRALLGAIAVACAIGWAIYARTVSQASLLRASGSERDLLRFLETLPKDVLLAGTPCALDNVPLFAKRQILFSCEQISAKAKIVVQALDAYYAEDERAVADFCREHGINYLVVDLDAYSQEYLAEERIFFEPYNQELLPLIAGRRTFALAGVAEDVRIFQSGDRFVVACDDLASRD